MDSILDLNRLYLQTPTSNSNIQSYTSINDVIRYLPKSQVIFCKNLKSLICGCNDTFAHLMGLKSGKDALNKSILELTPSEYGKELEEAEHLALDSLAMIEDARDLHRYFTSSPPHCITTAKVIPIYNDSEKIQGVLGIATQEAHLDNIENIFYWVCRDRINTLLKNKSYALTLPFGKVSLSNRETACLLFLMKGKTAKQIAREMCISYRTVECFITHIKEKMHCNLKSEIIALAYEYDLLKTVQKDLMIPS